MFCCSYAVHLHAGRPPPAEGQGIYCRPRCGGEGGLHVCGHRGWRTSRWCGGQCVGGVSGGCGCCAVRASWPLPRRDRFSRPRCVNRHDALSMSPLVPRSRCSPGPASDARITFDDGERFAADVGLVVIGGGGHSGAAAELCRRRRQAVVGAMKHAWSSYVKHAWGHDELDPQVVAALPPPFSLPLHVLQCVANKLRE